MRKRYIIPLVFFLLFSIVYAHPVAAEEKEVDINDLKVLNITLSSNNVKPGETITAVIEFNMDISNVTYVSLVFRYEYEDSKSLYFRTIGDVTGNSIVVETKTGQYLYGGEWNFDYIAVSYLLNEKEVYKFIRAKDISLPLYESLVLNVDNDNTDLVPPSISNFTMSKTEVLPGDKVRFSLEAEDNNSGVRYVSVRIIHFNEISDSILRGTSLMLKRVAGTNIFSIEYEIPKDMKAGLWYIKEVQVSDNAGNSSFIYHDSIGGESIKGVELYVKSDGKSATLGKYVIQESQYVENVFIDGNLYIGPNAVANFRGSVNVTGNVYVLGAATVTGRLTIGGDLNAVSVSYGSPQPLYNGSVHFRSGTHSISSIITSNQLFDIPHFLNDTNQETLTALDGFISIKGEYLPIVDMYINGELFDENRSGFFESTIDVSSLDAISVDFKDVLGRRSSKKYKVTHKSSDPSAVYANQIITKEQELAIKVGEIVQLEYQVLPEDSFNKNVVFESSNEKVVFVDNKGNVKAVGPGNAIITIRSVTSNVSTTVSFSAEQKVSKVEFPYEWLDISYGDEKLLEWKVSPSNSSNSSVEFESSNESVIEVDMNGYIRAVGVGSSTIKVTTLDGNFSDEVVVYVNARDITKLDFDELSSETYIGEEIKPKPNIYFEGNKLSEGVDFTVRYADNINSGNATAIVSGINSFSGVIYMSFYIDRASLYVDYSEAVVEYNSALQTVNFNKLDAFGVNGELIDGYLYWDDPYFIVDKQGYYWGTFYPNTQNYEPYRIAVYIMFDGWVLEDGNWYYYQNGIPLVESWKRISNVWHYFDYQGVMVTDWNLIDGTWYYMNSSGAMQTGWNLIGGEWYYMNISGAMQTGWNQISGIWYYMNNSGAMKTGWNQISDKWYYMSSSGAMQTGWVKVSNKWYYMNSSGTMQTGWVKVGNKWYYMNSSGVMLSNTKVGKYRLGKDGAML